MRNLAMKKRCEVCGDPVNELLRERRGKGSSLRDWIFYWDCPYAALPLRGSLHTVTHGIVPTGLFFVGLIKSSCF